jgi:hypothetical protein
MTDTQTIDPVAAFRDAMNRLRNAAGAFVDVIRDPDGNLRAAGPAGRLVVAPGQTIASAWGNTTYDQGVLCFANAGDRDAQWPAPHEGSQCYLYDAGTLWMYRSTAWKALPMGWVAAVTGPASPISAGSSPTAILTLSAPVIAGHWYRMNVVYMGTQQTAASASVRVTTSPSVVQFLGASNSLAQNQIFQASAPLLWQASTTGMQTFTLSASTNAGTILSGTGQCQLSIEDIGTP